MKKILILLFCSLLLISCSKTHNTKSDIKNDEVSTNQPTGFLWLKWGDKENIFNRVECTFDVESTHMFLEITAYKCLDLKKVENINGYQYHLYFYRNQFFMGSLKFNKDQLDILTSELYKKYGPPVKENLKRDILNFGNDMYRQWRVGNVLINVSFNEIEKQAKISYIFTPIGSSVNYRLEQDNEEPLFEE
jgi:hypothetical protein